MSTNSSQTSAPATRDFVDQYVRAIQFSQLPYSGLPAHAASHAAGGLDPISPASINAVGLTDPRLTDARNPLAHKASHFTGGSDALTPSNIGACSNTDPRLSDSRFPTAHKSTHATGGTDALSFSDIGACSNSDSRLSDARTPLAHKSSHAVGASDALAPSDILALPGVIFKTPSQVPLQLNNVPTGDITIATTRPNSIYILNQITVYISTNQTPLGPSTLTGPQIRAYADNSTTGDNLTLNPMTINSTVYQIGDCQRGAFTGNKQTAIISSGTGRNVILKCVTAGTRFIDYYAVVAFEGFYLDLV